jgi:Rrf2 family protein
MRFSKTTEYAIRVMVFLSDHHDRPHSVNRLHRTLNIPYKYLGRLMIKLAVKGLVKATQGKQGGYQINKNRSPIYLYEIIDIVEGLENYDRCILGFENCSDSNPCPLHTVWEPQQKSIKQMVYDTSLDDLSKGPGVQA